MEIGLICRISQGISGRDNTVYSGESTYYKIAL
ncbi:hypothetical protein GON09_001476 [Rhodococcus sp. B50]|nr:hypothetical protein [Rhodococcus sp. B50]